MRTLAYLFGGLLLLDGIPAIFSPYFWVHYSERNLRAYAHNPAVKTVVEFGKLSENTVRTKALAEVMIGMLLLTMASVMSAMMFAPRRGMAMRMGMTRHSHPHAHEGMRGEHAHPHGHWGHHEGEGEGEAAEGERENL